MMQNILFIKKRFCKMSLRIFGLKNVKIQILIISKWNSIKVIGRPYLLQMLQVTDYIQKLDEQYRDKGLLILAFPCNQFGNQEPKSEKDIKRFVKQFNAEFQFFKKIEVNGENTHPIFKYLRANSKKLQRKGNQTQYLKWNFCRFLLDKEGNVQLFQTTQKQFKSLRKEIEKLLE